MSKTAFIQDNSSHRKGRVVACTVDILSSGQHVCVCVCVLFSQGIEDAQGNMDFKVAGTRDGITSLQVES